MKIAMLDDKGTVTELIDEVHVCTGEEECGHVPASCEDCGAVATPGNPVYVWTSGTGLDYFACGVCLSADAYARLVRTGTNPESGETIRSYFDADGNPQ